MLAIPAAPEVIMLATIAAPPATICPAIATAEETIWAEAAMAVVATENTVFKTATDPAIAFPMIIPAWVMTVVGIIIPCATTVPEEAIKLPRVAEAVVTVWERRPKAPSRIVAGPAKMDTKTTNNNPRAADPAMTYAGLRPRISIIVFFVLNYVIGCTFINSNPPSEFFCTLYTRTPVTGSNFSITG